MHIWTGLTGLGGLSKQQQQNNPEDMKWRRCVERVWGELGGEIGVTYFIIDKYDEIFKSKEKNFERGKIITSSV